MIEKYSFRVQIIVFTSVPRSAGIIARSSQKIYDNVFRFSALISDVKYSSLCHFSRKLKKMYLMFVTCDVYKALFSLLNRKCKYYLFFRQTKYYINVDKCIRKSTTN